MSLQQQYKAQTNQRVWTIDWHPNGQLLACSGSSKNITLWSYKQSSLTKLSTIATEHSKTIRSVKFSHKGDKIAVGSFDSSISVWVYNSEAQDYEILSTLEGHENEVKCVSWNFNDQKIASCSRDKNIWVWDFDPVSYDYVCDAVLEGHTQDVKFVDWFTQHQNKLVSSSYDNTIRIWEGEDDDYVCRQVLEGHKSIVWAVVVQGAGLWSASEDCTVCEWGLNAESEKYQLTRVYEGMHYLPIYSLCVVGHKYCVTGSADNNICVFGLNSQKQQQSSLQANVKPDVLSKGSHESDVNCLKINPKHESLIASCSDDQTLRIWHLPL